MWGSTSNPQICWTACGFVMQRTMVLVFEILTRGRQENIILNEIKYETITHIQCQAPASCLLFLGLTVDLLFFWLFVIICWTHTFAMFIFSKCFRVTCYPQTLHCPPCPLSSPLFLFTLILTQYSPLLPSRHTLMPLTS